VRIRGSLRFGGTSEDNKMSIPPFDFFSVPRIVFGRGKIARLAELAKPLGQSTLLVYNGSDALADRVSSLVASTQIKCHTYRQHGEPKVADVDAALDAARGNQCDMVIGVGGGSAIDCAKAVAGLLTNGGTALDYMEVVGKGRKITQMAAPWIAIPTTAGTGAEVTRNAVIGAPEKKFKASIRGEQLLARIALVDPELGVSTPGQVTASSGMDALCQCIESYTSIGANPMTDALTLRGMRAAATSLRRAFENGNDIDAREQMALSALLSGITLTNAGLGAVHGFAAPLGANFPAPHGTVCAALLPHVIAANIAGAKARLEQHPVLSRYAEVGRACTGREALSVEAAIDAAAAFCADLARDLKISRLGEYGITESDIPAMVELARKASSMKFNPVVLTDTELSEVLRRAL
jgi:alcohol dehydrogenase class IV